jgi:hypothetical protein
MLTKLVAIALIAVLAGCASAGAGSSAPYAGRHDHQRDAKQGSVPSQAQPSTPATRKSLRPAG